MPLATADEVLAVSQLMAGYARALDRLDAALLRSLFHDDADIDMGVHYRGGPDGFVDVAMRFMGSMEATRHELQNVFVAAGADGLAAETYVNAWHVMDPARTRELLVRARYLNRFAKQGGGWRILRHSEVLDWGEERAANGGWFANNAELPKGERTLRDASYRALGSG